MAESNHSSVPEGFKEIPGYGGRYFIDKQSNIWSAVRNRLLTKHLNAKKMYLTCLMIDETNYKRPRLVHHLMAATWMEPCPGEWGASRGKYQINHKDGNKQNNSLENLEWVKHEENLRHAWSTGLQSFGENRPNSNFTNEQVREIRLRLIAGEKVRKLAEEFGVSVGNIKKIQQYVAWKRQDWDLVEPMMTVCSSKWLPITLDCIKRGGEFYDYSRLNGRLYQN
jgi:hypothetical protein